MTNLIIYDVNTGDQIGCIDKKESTRLIREAVLAGSPQPHMHDHNGLLLFNGNGEALVGLRGFDEESNADMYDKTVGGHNPQGFETGAAMLAASSRELKVPLAVVSRKVLFSIIANHPQLLDHQAFITDLDYLDAFTSTRVIEEGSYPEVCNQTLMYGAYNGGIKTEGEFTARPLGLERLVERLRTDGTKYTSDLRFMVDEYLNVFERLATKLQNDNSVENTGELVTMYDREGNLIDEPMLRKKAQQMIEEDYKAGRPQRYMHEHICGIFLRRNGAIRLQRRSGDKKENPGLYDKIVGGHLRAGDLPEVGAYHECIEEMQIPIAMYDDLTWRNILRQLPEATNKQAICKALERLPDFKSVRKLKGGGEYVEECIQYVTIGYYNGSFDFVDEEAGGIDQYESREQLAAAMEEKPELYTEDIKYMVKKFWDDLVPLEVAVGKLDN